MSIGCLTYNICFGCMADNAALANMDVTAKPLATTCLDPGGRNRCMDKVVAVIDGVAMKRRLDFIALQEATSHRVIQQRSRALSRMNLVSSKAKHEEMATFVHADWTIDAQVNGDIGDFHSGTYVPDAGRAFQIVVAHNAAGVSCVFVNAHNGQNPMCDKAHLARKLSYALDGVAARHVPRGAVVLVAGDFNDRGRFDFWKGFRPFAESTKHPHLNAVTVRCPPPPVTCCDSGNKYDNLGNPIFKAHSYGDYCMSNVDVANKAIADFGQMAPKMHASDHIPVVGTTGPVTAQAVQTTEGKTLRLAGDSSDPNGAGRPPVTPFQGQHLPRGSLVEFPGNTVFPSTNGDGVNFRLVYAKEYPHQIGYVRSDYIGADGRLTMGRTLRLLPNSADPNAAGAEHLRGANLASGTELRFVDGSKVTHNGFELLPIKSGDKIGFIRSGVVQAGGRGDSLLPWQAGLAALTLLMCFRP
jgi:hypothetical protein